MTTEQGTGDIESNMSEDANQRERRAQAHALLLAWYAREGRATLPWRHTRDPYAVLVSEIMLQQTQVERALPKYQAFLARFPTLAALAAAPTSDVIKEWAGLGYNMRAVRLHEIAEQAMAQGGALPGTLDGLLALKGIGRYTAGAIACFGLGLPVATVDTNIRRVLWRVFRGIEPAEWPTGEVATRGILALAEWALPVDTTAEGAVGGDGAVADASSANGLTGRAARVYDWQQALMDLGALVCQSRRPACERCPLTAICVAYAETAQVTLFPSGEALARLRDERAEAQRRDWDASASRDARHVAERRAGYAADDATMSADTGNEMARPQRPLTPAKRKQGARKRRVAQPFETTSRYFRGRIVDALRALPAGASLSLDDLGPQVKADFTPDELPWLRSLVDGLARDGLARLAGSANGGRGDAHDGHDGHDGDARVALP